MPEREELDFFQCAGEILHRMQGKNGGVLCTVVDRAGNHNVITLGWGQVGPFYEGKPIFTIAITPLRYSFRFIEELPEFVIAVPNDALRHAADLCGTESGRDMDKFHAAGLTKVESAHVAPPSVLECPINVECRVYTKIAPPHMLLTPRHRQRPVEEQHTIYFATVLGAYRYTRT
jgi:flavin reductase (DIM6/NTAB) family NADH-FMN oxidoreductase RutF